MLRYETGDQNIAEGYESYLEFVVNDADLGIILKSDQFQKIEPRFDKDVLALCPEWWRAAVTDSEWTVYESDGAGYLKQAWVTHNNAGQNRLMYHYQPY